MPSATASSSNGSSAIQHPPELRILLVEDSARLRVRLDEMLTTPGLARVTAMAATELEAAEQLDALVFDVLIVDVELREGSGINVVKKARARWPTPLKPLIIVLTNYALPTVKARCLAAGADYFLDKMQQFDQLQPLIVRHRA
jgi:two-component system, OmpR family, response regulator